MLFCFVKQKTAYEMRISDWSSDVCSSDLHVLDVNLQATNDRFQVGDLTRTDVAQSEARLALARSDLQTAEANLIGSRENYVRLVGGPPGELEPPPALSSLPASPDSDRKSTRLNSSH